LGYSLINVKRGLVSVIIPTWNRARDLPRAVYSVLAQTYENVEVLICDDGSTDESRVLIQGITDSRVHWIDGAHVGLPAAPRNRGLQVAEGEWVAFLDSDDYWLTNKLESQLNRIDASNGRLLASCCNAIRQTDFHVNEAHKLLLPRHTEDVEIGLKQLMEDNLVITSTVLLHRSLLPAIGAFPVEFGLKVGEDYAYWLRVASLTPIAFHGVALTNYYDSPTTSVRASARNEGLVKLRIWRNYFYWLASYKPIRLVCVVALSIFLEARGGLMRRWWRMRARLGVLKKTVAGILLRLK
jgi:glycosyltransferase involved in cell wall biosynthesis